jgi:hypothetical protein
MASESCATCRFWDRSDTSQEPVGNCRRRAPAINTELLRAFLPGRNVEWCNLDDYVYEASAFPNTHAKSWCGEFEPSQTAARVEAETA